jgi:hypothetical protein
MLGWLKLVSAEHFKSLQPLGTGISLIFGAPGAVRFRDRCGFKSRRCLTSLTARRDQLGGISTAGTSVRHSGFLADGAGDIKRVGEKGLPLRPRFAEGLLSQCEARIRSWRFG